MNRFLIFLFVIGSFLISTSGAYAHEDAATWTDGAAEGSAYYGVGSRWVNIEEGGLGTTRPMTPLHIRGLNWPISGCPGEHVGEVWHRGAAPEWQTLILNEHYACTFKLPGMVECHTSATATLSTTNPGGWGLRESEINENDEVKEKAGTGHAYGRAAGEPVFQPVGPCTWEKPEYAAFDHTIRTYINGGLGLLEGETPHAVLSERVGGLVSGL